MIKVACGVLLLLLLMLVRCTLAPPPKNYPQIPSVEALTFMKTYGYLEDNEDENSDALYTEEGLAETVKTLQRFGGIPQTGVIDNATLELIKKPRCGVPDIIRHERRKRFVLGPSGWKKRRLTYYVSNWSPKLGEYAVVTNIQKALDTWGKYGRLTFQRTSSPDSDIIVLFARNYHSDKFPFDGNGGVLAHAYFPNQGIGGDIHFDEDENWSDKKPDAGDDEPDFYSVALHELGHSLGLAHSSDQTSVMFPYYGVNEEGTEPQLNYDDILAMYELYIRRPIQDDDASSESEEQTTPPAPRRPQRPRRPRPPPTAPPPEDTTTVRAREPSTTPTTTRRTRPTEDMVTERRRYYPNVERTTERRYHHHVPEVTTGKRPDPRPSWPERTTQREPNPHPSWPEATTESKRDPHHRPSWAEHTTERRRDHRLPWAEHTTEKRRELHPFWPEHPTERWRHPLPHPEEESTSPPDWPPRVNPTHTYEGDTESVDEHLKHDGWHNLPRNHNPTLPNICGGYFDAVATLRNELFVFKDQYIWRVRRRPIIEPGYPVTLHSMFPDLPKEIKRIDAAYQRSDGMIVLFIGDQYWVSDGEHLIENSPLPLTDYGLPDDLDSIDAVQVWQRNGKIYFYKDDRFWRFNETVKTMDAGYPRSMSIWRGVPNNIDAATTWKDGYTYFFKGNLCWKLDNDWVMATEHSPWPAAQWWLGCQEDEEMARIVEGLDRK